VTTQNLQRGRAREPSKPRWRVLDLGQCEPLRAVAFAEAVAPSVAQGESPNTLIFARTTKPCVSIGFHQSAGEELEPGLVRRHRLTVIRRVEGGGTVYLDRDQLFYEFVYAGTPGGYGGRADFARYLQAPVAAARSLGLAVELRPPSDLVIRGRKISGNAGGEWGGAQLIVGDLLGRSDVRRMADLLRLPHPALRPLLRREVARWITSWEREVGRLPDWYHLKEEIVGALRQGRLGPVEVGYPTHAEEAAFRSETLPRHRNHSWQSTPAPAHLVGHPSRRIRVAGPHGIIVFEDSSKERHLVSVVQGTRVVDAFSVGVRSDDALRPLKPGTPIRRELERRVARTGGFE